MVLSAPRTERNDEEMWHLPAKAYTQAGHCIVAHSFRTGLSVSPCPLAYFPEGQELQLDAPAVIQSGSKQCCLSLTYSGPVCTHPSAQHTARDRSSLIQADTARAAVMLANRAASVSHP